ncbi:vomeronasal type-2 receptor 26-like [Gastrophryne carolinensis]
MSANACRNVCPLLPQNHSLISLSNKYRFIARNGDSGYCYWLLPWLMTVILQPQTQAHAACNRAHGKNMAKVELAFGFLKTLFQCMDHTEGPPVPSTEDSDQEVWQVPLRRVALQPYYPTILVPQSRCSESCPPGYRKAPINGAQACCYYCVQCSEGEVSNVTDSEICLRCPDEEWPDERKETCRPKIIEYLSFLDVLTLLFSVISVLGSVISAAILKLFISFWDSPVVKANNRTVSIILLTSILLSFLCVFLFLGRPVDITCMLRQVSFGIFFTISVSCVLAKTIIVCIAFKTTKPGSYWNKWVGTKLANYVVLICSSIQVLICVIWLSVSRPYQEYDMSSYHEKIIIQCNEGSVIGFYIMLGYLGFLAAVSFVLAFMVRTLPDSFNEAKYITFSMLVFCSVWIAMIPAYLSTRGKYMVAVEIFTILTSCAGLLGCIFFPKLYFFVIKPEMNTRLYVAGK